MEGLIRCSIVPPDNLYHPVRPYRCNSELMLCLCRTCFYTPSEECTHTENEDRALTGTWVMDEVRLAVQKGYRILEIHEVYEYQVTQYNPETGDGGLFVNYINTFLKLKAESSGYPGWVRSPADEDRYVESFWKIEGIRLDRECISFNAAKRGLAKLDVGKVDGAERSDYD